MKRVGLLTIVTTFCFLIGSFADAETLSARIVGLADGDTIAVLDNYNQAMLTRLAGIDAREHTQDYGKESVANLSRLIFRKGGYARLRWSGKLRTKGLQVLLPDGEDVDLDQIGSGFLPVVLCVFGRIDACKTD